MSMFARRLDLWLAHVSATILARAKRDPFLRPSTDSAVLFIQLLANALAAENPHFDRGEFLSNAYNLLPSNEGDEKCPHHKAS